MLTNGWKGVTYFQIDISGWWYAVCTSGRWKMGSAQVLIRTLLIPILRARWAIYGIYMDWTPLSTKHRGLQYFSPSNNAGNHSMQLSLKFLKIFDARYFEHCETFGKTPMFCGWISIMPVCLFSTTRLVWKSANTYTQHAMVIHSYHKQHHKMFI